MDPSQEASPLNRFYNSQRIPGQVHSAMQATLRKPHLQCIKPRVNKNLLLDSMSFRRRGNNNSIDNTHHKIQIINFIVSSQGNLINVECFLDCTPKS